MAKKSEDLEAAVVAAAREHHFTEARMYKLCSEGQVCVVRKSVWRLAEEGKQ